jgi:hypothetical protein
VSALIVILLSQAWALRCQGLLALVTASAKEAVAVLVAQVLQRQRQTLRGLKGWVVEQSRSAVVSKRAKVYKGGRTGSWSSFRASMANTAQSSASDVAASPACAISTARASATLCVVTSRDFCRPPRLVWPTWSS